MKNCFKDWSQSKWASAEDNKSMQNFSARKELWKSLFLPVEYKGANT